MSQHVTKSLVGQVTNTEWLADWKVGRDLAGVMPGVNQTFLVKLRVTGRI